MRKLVEKLKPSSSRGNSRSPARGNVPARDSASQASVPVTSTHVTDDPSLTPPSNTTQPANFGPKSAAEVKTLASINHESSGAPIFENALAQFGNAPPKHFKELDLDPLSEENLPQAIKQSPANAETQLTRSLTVMRRNVPNLKAVATALSRLDPHGIAPYVVTGLFGVADFCLANVDETAKEKARNMIADIYIVIDKWVYHERFTHSTQAAKIGGVSRSEAIQRLESHLAKLYMCAFQTQSILVRDCQTARKMQVKVALGATLKWDAKLAELNRLDAALAAHLVGIKAQLDASKDDLEVLKWIKKDDDPEKSYEDMCKATGLDSGRYPEAGKWLLGLPEYRDWYNAIRNDQPRGESTDEAGTKAVNGPNQSSVSVETSAPGSRVFWLRGTIGTGKTTLVARVISELHDIGQDLDVGDRTLAYYFCTVGASDTSGVYVETIVRALCRQLAWLPLSRLSPSAKLKKAEETRPGAHDKKLRLADWQDLLGSLILEHKQPIVFVIDALNEAKDPRRLLIILAKLLISHSNLWLFCSSQPQTRVPDGLNDEDPGIGQIRMVDTSNDANEADMSAYISNYIEGCRHVSIHKESVFLQNDCGAELCERLATSLKRGAKGVFRWTEIWLESALPKSEAVRQVKDESRAESILEAIEASVSGSHQGDVSGDSRLEQLYSAYDSLWTFNMDDSRYQALIQPAFHVLLAAYRPLSVKIVVEALNLSKEMAKYSTRPEASDVEAMLYNFFRVAANDELVWVHESAQIHIQQRKGPHGLAELRSKACNHLHITRLMLQLLCDADHSAWTAAGINMQSLQDVAHSRAARIAEIAECSSDLRAISVGTVDPLQDWTAEELILAMRPPSTKTDSKTTQSDGESDMRKLRDMIRFTFVGYAIFHWCQHLVEFIRLEPAADINGESSVYADLRNLLSKPAALLALDRWQAAMTWLLSRISPAQREKWTSQGGEFIRSLKLHEAWVTHEPSHGSCFLPAHFLTSFELLNPQSLAIHIGGCGISTSAYVGNVDGRTALHLSCEQGHQRGTAALLEHEQQQGSGVHPSLIHIRDAGGRLPIHLAVNKGATGSLQMLLEHELTLVNEATADQNTPGKKNTALSAIESQIYSGDYGGRTPAHLSAQTSWNVAGLWECVEFLLGCGKLRNHEPMSNTISLLNCKDHAGVTVFSSWIEWLDYSMWRTDVMPAFVTLHKLLDTSQPILQFHSLARILSMQRYAPEPPLALGPKGIIALLMKLERLPLDPGDTTLEAGVSFLKWNHTVQQEEVDKYLKSLPDTDFRKAMQHLFAQVSDEDFAASAILKRGIDAVRWFHSSWQ